MLYYDKTQLNFKSERSYIQLLSHIKVMYFILIKVCKESVSLTLISDVIWLLSLMRTYNAPNNLSFNWALNIKCQLLWVSIVSGLSIICCFQTTFSFEWKLNPLFSLGLSNFPETTTIFHPFSSKEINLFMYF